MQVRPRIRLTARQGEKVFLQHPKLQRALSEYIEYESDESNASRKATSYLLVLEV